MKSGQEGVPTEEEYLTEVMPDNGTLGFDGRVVNSQMGQKLKELLEDKHVKFSWQETWWISSGKTVRSYPQNRSGF